MDSTFGNDQAGQNALASQIYDKIMCDIEPELLLSNIPLLDAKYAGESKEDNDVRMKRYAAAKKKFDQKFAECKVALTPAIRSARKEELHAEEQRSLSQDAEAIQSILSKF